MGQDADAHGRQPISQLLAAWANRDATARDRLLPIVHRCVIDRDLFASELVVRAGRAGVEIVEIPVRVQEKRRPAINLVRRVPNVLKNLARLTYVIRIKG